MKDLLKYFACGIIELALNALAIFMALGLSSVAIFVFRRMLISTGITCVCYFFLFLLVAALVVFLVLVLGVYYCEAENNFTEEKDKPIYDDNLEEINNAENT